MTKFRRSNPPGRERQRFFTFFERHRRHDRWFKRAIVVATVIAVVVPLATLAMGRYLVAEVAVTSAQAGRRVLQVATPRSEDRPGLAAVSASRNRRLTIAFDGDLRVEPPGVSTAHALRRARSCSWLALRRGNYDPDPSAALDRL